MKRAFTLVEMLVIIGIVRMPWVSASSTSWR